MDDTLRYPIGRFELPTQITAQMRQEWIAEIAELPQAFERTVVGLTPEQLATRYRPGGWTIRQVVHHMADASMNSYIRFKLALTEDNPIIKPYAEDRWAELVDYQDTPVVVSLALLDSLHQRWTVVLQSMTDEQFARAFIHPDGGPTTLEQALAMYAWHGRHHLAHVTSALERTDGSHE